MFFFNTFVNWSSLGLESCLKCQADHSILAQVTCELEPVGCEEVCFQYETPKGAKCPPNILM